MKSPKPIVAGALVAGGLLFSTAAAAITLPESASDTAKEQVETFLSTLPEGAHDAGETRGGTKDEAPESDETKTDTEASADVTDAEETDGDGGERPATHGSEVSAFATGDAKELPGRERGEAISDLARSNGGAGDETDAEDDVDDDDTDDDTDDDDTEDDDSDKGAAGAARAAQARQGK